MRRLSVVFHFRDDGSDDDALLAPFWQPDAQGQRRLYYSVRATWREQGVSASRRFVDHPSCSRTIISSVILTQLPALDIENFLFQQGFRDVYLAHLPLNVKMSDKRIITKAIHQTSKPELAIAVASSAAARGPDAIPALMREMFARVIGLA